MATDAKRVPTTGGTGLEAIGDLLKIFGTNTTQKVTGQTGPLQDLLKELATPVDGTKQLESIFQTAAGGIPKFQAAFGNAVGARSGNNSSVSAALESLLQQTTLAGQKQLADQQAQRDSTRANAAGALAQATRGVNQKQGNNLADAGKALGVLQLAGKLGITDKAKSLFSGGAATQAPTGFSLSSPDTFGMNDVNFFNSSNLPGNYSLPGGGIADFDFSTIGDAFSAVPTYGSGLYDIASGASDLASGAAAAGDAASSGGSWLGDAVDSVKSWFGFADGGLVGRDGEEIPAGQTPGVQTEDDRLRKEAIARANAKRTPQKPSGIGDGRPSQRPPVAPAAPYTTAKERGGGFPHVDNSLYMMGFADGGLVRSGGGRRSSAPGYSTTDPGTSSALNMVADQFGLPAMRRDLDADWGSLTGEDMSVQNAGIGAQGSNGLGVSGPSGGPAIGLTPMQAFSVAMNIANPTPLGFLSLAKTINSVVAANALAESHNLDTNPNVNGTVGDIGVGTGGSPSEGATGSVSVGSDANAAAPGGVSDSAGNTGATSSGPADGYSQGGKVSGPGTPTSDSVHIRASKNEYIVPADVVDTLGVEFFDNLRDRFHTMTQPASR